MGDTYYGSLSNSLFNYDGSNPKDTIFDVDSVYNPKKNVKSDSEMGITNVTSTGRQFILDISNNTAKFDKYTQALVSSTSSSLFASKPDNPLKSPYPSRFFVKSDMKTCIDLNGDKQPQYMIVDGISTDGGGLIGSTENTINDIYKIDSTTISNIITQASNLDNDVCKKVKLKTNDATNVTETQYVSQLDYDTYIQKYGKDSGIVTEGFEMFTGGSEIIVGKPQKKKSTYIIDKMDDYDVYDEFKKNKYPYSSVQHKKINYEHNVVSNFFLGSVTVLGLYVVFRFLNR